MFDNEGCEKMWYAICILLETKVMKYKMQNSRGERDKKKKEKAT